VSAQEPIELPAENSLGVVSALEPIENSRGVVSALELIEVQALEPIELPTEKSPGVVSALDPIEFPDLEAALATPCATPSAKSENAGTCPISI